MKLTYLSVVQMPLTAFQQVQMWIEGLAWIRLNLAASHHLSGNSPATVILRLEHIHAQDRIGELHHYMNNLLPITNNFVASLPNLQAPDLLSQQELLGLHLGPLPRTAAEMLSLLEMAVRLEARLCDAQLNGDIDPILGYVVPVGSYPPSPSHMFHTSIRIPSTIAPPIAVHAIEDEEMAEDNLSDLEEDWLVEDHPPHPPSPVFHPLPAPVYGHDWPEAVDLNGPNGIVIGSDDGSTDTEGVVGGWEGGEEGEIVEWPEWNAAVDNVDVAAGFVQGHHMG